MNKKLGLAVAGALLAASASAQAGITIPAGDWTIDVGGNVNAYYTHTNYSGSLKHAAGISDTANTVQTGLLPSALGIGGKTRQNDLDISFQFTFFTGIDSNGAASSVYPYASGYAASGAAGSNSLNIRQAYMTFGDASWGTVKAGRDLGIFGGDAILSDMTLLGVGVGSGSYGSSTLGRIGSGYMYADWVGQISYTSPNWNGFQFAVGAREPWTNSLVSGSNSAVRNDMGYQGKVTYDFKNDDLSGRVWLSAISQRHDTDTGSATSYTSRGIDVGAKAAVGNLGLVGYYYDGKGLSGPQSGLSGLMFLGGNKTDDKGGYVQATYVIPTGTKLGASWGQSVTENNHSNDEFKNRSWIVGAYHPITKSLNLVAEYTNQKLKYDNAEDGEKKTVSLGAILFF